MAIVSIFVGQCGVQMGTEYLTSVAECASASKDDAFQHAVSSTFFRRGAKEGPPVARCVLVDMEPKVIDACTARVSRSNLFSLDSTRCVTRDEGSANNWAFGYFGQGGSREESIRDSIRREIEICDSLGGVHVVHSVAGGTGSGVGSLVSDVVRQILPRAALLHTVVWPFRQGEVMTQCINATLTVKVLDETADGIHVLSNDDALRNAVSASQHQSLEAKVSKRKRGYGGINEILAQHMSCFTLPRSVVSLLSSPVKDSRWTHQAASQESSRYIVGGQLIDNLEATSLDPRRKFFSSTLQNATDGQTWAGLVASVADAVACESGLLVLRGDSALTNGTEAATRRLFSTIHSSSIRMKNENVAACYAPHSSFADRLHKSASTVEGFLQSGAFLHHYSDHGVDRDFLTDTILHVWGIHDAYS